MMIVHKNLAYNKKYTSLNYFKVIKINKFSSHDVQFAMVKYLKNIRSLLCVIL